MCKRVQTGAIGCEWVRMGALGRRGHGEHKNNARVGHLRSRGSGFGTYGRGKFPGHDVFVVLPKIDKNGHRWVIMGRDECN